INATTMPLLNLQDTSGGARRLNPGHVRWVWRSSFWEIWAILLQLDCRSARISYVCIERRLHEGAKMARQDAMLPGLLGGGRINADPHGAGLGARQIPPI